MDNAHPLDGAAAPHSAGATGRHDRTARTTRDEHVERDGLDRSGAGHDGLGAGFPADIAAAAANLAERMTVVQALHTHNAAAPEPPGALGKIDTWRIERLAAKLAAKFRKEAMHRSEPSRHDERRLTALLTTYRRYELHLPHMDAAVRQPFTEPHTDWLPVYEAALTGFDEAPRTRLYPAGQDFDVQYGRLAKAAEPFLVELGRRLEHALTLAGGSCPAAFDPRLIADFQEHLLDRFELALAWAVETDAKVHCARHGLDPVATGRDEYLAYLDATFADAACYHRFYLRFPVLGRWLAQVTGLLAEHAGELTSRLAADWERLPPAVGGRRIQAFRSVRPGRSDHHAGARTVTFVEVETADGEHATFVYKPRDIRTEAAMQDLLGRLSLDGVLGFATRTVLPRNGYGYEARIPGGRNRLASRSEVEQVYQELGGHLAIFYVLGGGDLHFENVIVADGHAYICDCETVFGVLPEGQHRPEDTLLDSVFKTGLLEWPQQEPETGEPSGRTAPAGQEDREGRTGSGGAAGGGTQMRISGYSGGEAYELPVPVPRVNAHRLTFRAAVTHTTGVLVRPDAANRVHLGDRLVHPQEHIESIMKGFERVYDWFRRRPDDRTRELSHIFAGASARFINWGTQIYAQLLMSARHPRCLMEPLEVDLLANTVRTFPRTWDRDGVLADRELRSLWRLDVPIFTADVHGRRLVHDHITPLPSRLEVSPLDYAVERVRRLSPEHRTRQTQYIAAALDTGELRSPAFVATSLGHAARIGDRLCRTLRAADAPAPWTSYDLAGEGMTEADVQGDLYHGSAGIALFLAYLNDLDPRPEFRAAAERALEHAISSCDRHRIGAFQGVGGLIYLLTHLHHLWGDRALLDLAVRLADELPDRIGADRRLDVLGGVAGLIPVLLGLAEATGGRGVALAHRCADHLARTARPGTAPESVRSLMAATGDAVLDPLSWPSYDPAEVTADLTGFAHGTAGIGWALIMLGRVTGRDEWVTTGRRAFAYEALHFDDAEQNWPDLRIRGGGTSRGGRHFANAWCNGAAGIGMSRISSWAVLGGTDETLLREAHQGLAATMRDYPRLMNDTLCHGRCGNAELFLRFGRLHGEPAFELEANVQVRTQWRNLDAADAGTATSSAGFFPGLMVGMSGFGMHFLRLARPDRVPSVLLLDPPQP